MRRIHALSLAAALAAAPLAGAQTAAPPAQEVGPRAGDAAPDFTLPASRNGTKLASHVQLSKLKGQVVVLAFFPRARTSG
jgi:hypothetical protein